MSAEFTPISEASGPGEVRANLDVLASLFPDAMVDGRVDFDVLRDLLGEAAEPAGTEAFGLRWPGMSDARRLSTLPATGTLLPMPDESVEWDQTNNIVIEGDNLEVLRLLRRGYTNKVDVIYIDPPYNTGNDFVYDDSRMSSIAEYEADAGQRDDDGATQVGDDSDRAQDRRAGASKHATWLSMMYPRLLVAHHLLKETGVIIAAIDDTEHARLKLLLDRVFGAENLVASVVWQGGVDGYASYVSVKHDYMLIYAKSKAALDALGTRWREPSLVAPDALDAAAELWAKSGGDRAKTSAELHDWWSARVEADPGSSTLAHFDTVDEDGRVFYGGDAGAPVWRANRCFKRLIHPVTGRPTPSPKNGWRWDESELERRHAAGLIVFGADETTVPKRKDFLKADVGQVSRSVFEQDRRGASSRLEDFLGAKVFEFPKDERVLARWLRTVGASNALVLDFFAGSGSTGHAIMDLNAADGGCRRYILIQLDEPVSKDSYDTIAQITRERLRRAGRKIAENLSLESANTDLGFRSYRLTSSNIRPWDGSAEQLNLIEAVDNLVEGRGTEDLLVEMMLRLGVELTTPVSQREVADSPLYNLGGTLYAYFGTEITTARANEIARALVAWRAEDPVDSDVTVVVRDTGFVDSSAKLNLAAALTQAGFTTLRSI